MSVSFRKYKNKIVEKHQDGGNFRQSLSRKKLRMRKKIKIIRTKHFGIKPMYPGRCLCTDGASGHNFFVFRNAETDEVCVVYKRKGNTYD